MTTPTDRNNRQHFTWQGSIQLKLSAVTALLVFFCILLVTAAAAWRTFEHQTSAAGQRLQGVATVMANAVSDHVDKNDKAATASVLGSIEGIGDVNYAMVMTPGGSPLAQAGPSEFVTDDPGAMETITASNLIVRDTFWVSEPVVLDGVHIASLHLLADLSPMRAEFAGILTTNVLAALLIASATAVMVFMVIGGMIRPVISLARMMTRLGEEADFTTRARVERRDEVGALAQAFNVMLDQIQHRDRDLEDYRTQLEEKVDERTRALHKATEAAMMANMAKSDFIATMSHEIRTPMNGMMVMAEMLANAPLGAKHRRQAQIIHRSGRSLLAIINDILDLSKIEAGGIELERIDFSLDTVLDDTVSLYAEKAREKSLALTVSVAPDVALGHIGDPTRISQIISNLISNALKFTAEGGVDIAVTNSGGITPDGRQHLAIAVRDSGIGIAAHKQATIFDAFTQAEQSTTREYGGTGLGLSICRRLADAMGGSMRVDSILGKGSTFIFSVQLEVETPADTKPCLCGKRFALLTSSAFVRETLGAQLRAHGGDVVSALTAIDAACALTDDERMILLADQGASAMRDHDVAMRSAAAGKILLVSDDGATADESGYDAVMPLALHRHALVRLSQAMEAHDLSMLALDEADCDSGVSLPDYSRLRVLAVDDNAVNREVIRETLHALGVDADFAENGRDAIRLAGAVRYDTIFMDCSMPEMDGFEATRRIRAEEARPGHRAYITALTAHVGGQTGSAYGDAGMDDFVGKPFTMDEIIAVLNRSTSDDTSAAPDTGNQQCKEPVWAPMTGGASDVPLLAAQTVAMFDQLGQSVGSTMKANVFGLFIQHGPDAMVRLTSAVQDGATPGELRDLAHALKSMCASAGAERARQCAEAVEEQAAEGELPDRTALAGLQQSIEATVDQMRAEMQGKTTRNVSLQAAAGPI
jgi:signal transduction histidine kinase/FixJ family two-component response regulator/HPt (histidine-containing phosphotransfer) domain-containing protein